MLLDSLDGRGRGFEQLSAWFLQNDAEWAPRMSHVWQWDQWPGRWGPDRGIDLVAETIDGDLIAVQCKHYGLSHSIAKAEVDSFLSESNRHQFVGRALIATTNTLSAGALQVIAAQEKPVTVILRDRLEAAPLEWKQFSISSSPRLAAKAPRPHQERAMEEVLAGFESEDRGRLLMPCGTGKTLTSLWIAERLEAETTAVLVPTLDLVRQTALVWCAEASVPFTLLKVCSERADHHDEIARADLALSEVGNATTDPAEIAAFLGRDGKRVIVGTYDSSPRIEEAFSRLPGARLDLVICDEAHHCTGIEGRARKTVLDDSKIPANRRLFATATPAIFSAPARDQARELQIQVASMDDVRRFGSVFHRLSFKRATEEGLLCPFRVVVMPILDTDVAELVRRRKLVTPDDGVHVTDAYNLAAQIACLRTMSRFGCRRLVAFHPGVPDSRRFSADLGQAAQLLDADDVPADLEAAHVDGYMNKGKREQILGRFTNDEHPHLLSNVRLLAEGVDVPGIDAICLIDTNRGPASVVQAVGRAVRLAPGKEFGTVLLPLLVSEGQTAEDALRHSTHKPVLQVLAALRSLDAEITSSVDAIRTELGPQKPRTAQASSHWVIDGPASVGKEFGKAVEVCLVDALGGDRPKAQTEAIEDHAPEEVLRRPGVSGTVQWSSAEIVDVGLEWAEHQRRFGAGPLDLGGIYNGFSFERWTKAVLRRWEKGQLSKDQMSRCAIHFNWLELSSRAHPKTRREIAELDQVELHERLDEWLCPFGAHRDDPDLEKLLREGHIGSFKGLTSQPVLKLIPKSLRPPERVLLTISALKIGGRAMSDALDSGSVARGFLEALEQPGKRHELEGKLEVGKPPRGSVQNYEYGWDAGQEAVKLIERRVGKLASAAPHRDRRSRGRGKPRRATRRAA